jgi:putative secretion ATPase (PEP-CTERM system associated)
MYKPYYGFTRKPFDLLSNPDFLFLSPSHRKALTYLEYALDERSGFVLLTGAVGSGKTTIIRKLQQNLSKDIVFAQISHTILTVEQLIAMINEDFGLDGTVRDKVASLKTLNSFLIEQYGLGKKPLLIIDEAQNLSLEILEEIRLLSNLEANDAKLLQIMLVGQPELQTKIQQPVLQQLRQRISVYCTIAPLTLVETRDYILHRLAVAGNRDAVKFSKEALVLIWQQSRGIPRLINIICDFTLLSAFSDQTAAITSVLVRETIDDMGMDKHFWGNKSAPAAGLHSGRSAVTATASPRSVPQAAAGFFEIIELEPVDEIMEGPVETKASPFKEAPAKVVNIAAAHGPSGVAPREESATTRVKREG